MCRCTNECLMKGTHNAILFYYLHETTILTYICIRIICCFDLLLLKLKMKLLCVRVGVNHSEVKFLRTTDSVCKEHLFLHEEESYGEIDNFITKNNCWLE